MSRKPAKPSHKSSSNRGRVRRPRAHIEERDIADVPFEFSSPESSSINRADYDVSTETLTVGFRPPTAQGSSSTASQFYQYNKFPLGLWVEFYQANSKGQFFAHRIRPFYTGAML